MKLKSLYQKGNHHYFERPDGSIRIDTIIPEEENMTDSQFAEDCDINKIMKKYSYNQMPAPSQGTYADLTALGDYRSSLEAVMKAEEAFMQFPSNIRSKFENDPQLMIDYLSDPKNLEESYTLGLRTKPPESEIQALHNTIKSQHSQSLKSQKNATTNKNDDAN